MCRNDVLFGYNIAFAMTFVSCTTAADFPEIMLLTTLAQRLYTYYHYYNYYLCLCPEDHLGQPMCAVPSFTGGTDLFHAHV